MSELKEAMRKLHAAAIEAAREFGASEEELEAVKLPEPAEHQYLIKDWRGSKVWADGIPAGQQHFGTRALYTADQLTQAILQERQANLDAVAALSRTSRDREEAVVIGRCWDEINCDADARKP